MFKISLYFKTISYLKPKQILYQIFYRIKRYLKISINVKRVKFEKINFLKFDENFYNYESYYFKNKFSFLNIKHDFKKNIDWEFSKHGKLWTYNLNYFDFLNQKNISKEESIYLILDFIKKRKLIKIGKDSYPTSIRIVNFIKFVSKYKIDNSKINGFILSDVNRLYNNIEYHISGNHILENCFSLLYASLFFKDFSCYNKAHKILKSELDVQILDDGAHYELSPMYHNILLSRIINLISVCNHDFNINRSLLNLLTEKASKMLSWSFIMTFNETSFPLFNDSTNLISPTLKQINRLAKNNNISFKQISLGESGYRKFSKKNFQIIIDIGNLGPDHQLAHSHADTFNFELYVGRKPFIVDKGISTYEKGDIRKLERSTKSHNTVVVDDKNSSEIWDVFRVANRAKVIEKIEKENYVKAVHNGYKKINVLHSREWFINDKTIKINDKILGSSKLNSNAYFHFHPNRNIKKNKNIIYVDDFNKIIFKNFQSILVEDYNYSSSYNSFKKSKVVKVKFFKELSSEIIINNK